MEVVIEASPELGSLVAARIIAKQIREKPAAVLGLATGNTPITLYRELVRLHREDGLDFSRVTTFNLDEYVGLDANHPASYHSYMKEHLFKHINISPDRIYIPDGHTKRVAEFCQWYETAIKQAGGIDIQVLGIGLDGHIGFNEPTSALTSRTRIKTLTEETRSASAAEFGSREKVPHHVITMGIGTILESRSCLVLAFGAAKASIVAKTVEGPLTSFVPASALQMHAGAKIVVDRAAAAELKLRDYYQYVYNNKPAWQQF